LTVLIDKSLAVIDERTGISRYRLFAMLRDYARERGHESPQALADIAAISARHAEYYGALARAELARSPGLRGSSTSARLRAESENLRAARAWAQTRTNSRVLTQELDAALGRIE